MNCRPAILLAFIVACVAVVGVDRYLTTDAIALAHDANLYNIRELAQIRATQDAQVCAGYGLRVAEINAEELKKVSALNEKLIEVGAKHLQENICLREAVRCMEQLLLQHGVDLSTTPPATPTPPVEEDRST